MLLALFGSTADALAISLAVCAPAWSMLVHKLALCQLVFLPFPLEQGLRYGVEILTPYILGGTIPVEFLDAQQRDERRFKKVALVLFMVFLSVLTTYVMQYIGYFDLTLR